MNGAFHDLTTKVHDLTTKVAESIDLESAKEVVKDTASTLFSSTKDNLKAASSGLYSAFHTSPPPPSTFSTVVTFLTSIHGLACLGSLFFLATFALFAISTISSKRRTALQTLCDRAFFVASLLDNVVGVLFLLSYSPSSVPSTWAEFFGPHPILLSLRLLGTLLSFLAWGGHISLAPTPPPTAMNPFLALDLIALTCVSALILRERLLSTISTHTWGLLGATCSMLMAATPQIISLLETGTFIRAATGVGAAPLLHVGQVICASLWLAYSLQIKNFYMIFPNLVVVACAALPYFLPAPSAPHPRVAKSKRERGGEKEKGKVMGGEGEKGKTGEGDSPESSHTTTTTTTTPHSD